jgi:hypothetical protein
MSNVKKGVSLEEKAEDINGFSMVDYDNFDFQDKLAVDPSLIKELKNKNLKYRWINAHQLTANYGFDSRMWRPYKAEKSMKSSVYGQSDSEGYIRRGDLILAVQPNEIFNKRKQIIDQRNLANKAAMGSKEAAKSLRASFKANNIKGKIEEDSDSE